MKIGNVLEFSTGEFGLIVDPNKGQQCQDMFTIFAETDKTNFVVLFSSGFRGIFSENHINRSGTKILPLELDEIQFKLIYGN